MRARPEGLRGSKHSPRWEPLSAGLDSPPEKPPRAYCPGGGVGEAPDAHGDQNLVDQGAQQTQTKENQHQSMTIGRQAAISKLDKPSITFSAYELL